MGERGPLPMAHARRRTRTLVLPDAFMLDEPSRRAGTPAGPLAPCRKLSGSVRPGQVIVYNGWDPYQFKGWTGPMDVEPGMVKWLHFAGGYGHLRYWPIQWQPVQVDRAVRVDVEKLPAAGTG